MKRIFTIALFALFLVQSSIWAQTSEGIVGVPNIDNFPQVFIDFHSHNPDEFTEDAFRDLTENGEVRNFTVKVLPPDNQQMPQHILILWEDMVYHGMDKFNFTRNALTEFFNNVNIPAGTQFSISTFNRIGNRTTILNNLTDGFTGDRERIISAIQNHERSTVRFSEFPGQSEAFVAINEGMDILPPDGVRAIIIFTVGRLMNNSATLPIWQVTSRAQHLHIPTYVFQFYRDRGIAPQLIRFAEDTHGLFFGYQDASTAIEELGTLFPQISKRYRGHRYRILFESNASEGDAPRAISFRVNGVPFTGTLYPPPSSQFWIVERARENVWLSIGLAILLLALLALITWFILKLIAKRKKEIEDKIAESEKENQQHISKLTKAVTDAEQKRIDAEKERLAKEEYERQEAERKEKEKEYKRLTQLMRTKNLLPRLQCKDKNGIFTFNVNTPHTTIGRKGYPNDLQLDYGSVSRHHADIIFKDNGSFEMINKSKTNKVLINGEFIESATLKNGDIIGLGEAVVTFYV